jgi:hypothetical protein
MIMVLYLQFWRGVLLAALGALAACEPDGALGSQSDGLALNHPTALVVRKFVRTPVQYPFRFVILSDAHLPDAEAIFIRIREQMLLLDPPPIFAINLGDFTGDGSMKEHQFYLSKIDQHPVPFISIIGNHEQGVAEGRKNYESLFGPEDFSFDYAGCRFVGLNDIVIGHDGLRDEQVGWLERVLSDPKVEDKFVFMHAPPPAMPPPWGAMPCFNEDRFYQIIEGNGIRLVGTGHIHEFRHKTIRGVQYVITGGAGGGQDPLLENPSTQGIFHHFVLITVFAEGKSKLEVFKLDEPEPDPNYTTWFTTRVVQP